MLLNRLAAPAFPFLLLLAVAAGGQIMDEGVRVVYAFSKNPGANCEIELTNDSVRFLSEYRLHEKPMAEQGIAESEPRRVLGKRVLTAGEKDSAQTLMSLAGRWKGYRRFVCAGGDGYAFSLWSDSLLLNCDNCFSCTEGVSMPDARTLARFGKMTLWLYGLREAWQPVKTGSAPVVSSP